MGGSLGVYPSPLMRPNVLLIVLDAARADHIEPYGAPPGLTPAIADLASRGEVVERAYAASCWTIPSHAAMFSGSPPRSIGMGKAPNGTPKSCRGPLEAARDRLLAPVLNDAGYDTRAVTANAWLLPGSGFDIGFDQYELVRPSRQLKLDSDSRRERFSIAREAVLARADDGAGRTLDVLREWTDQPRSKPFFWFVNLVEAHSPYLPPKPFNSLGPLGRLRALGDARRYQKMDAIWLSYVGHLEVPKASLERMRRLYRDSIRALDAWVGSVLEVLDTAGVLADTQVLVTSDHGENLGENGTLGHAFSLDDRLLRVPLVSSGPTALDADEVTSLADIPRLIADAIGLADHPWQERGIPRGTAVAQFDPPVGPEDPTVQEALGLWDLDAKGLPALTSWLSAATDGHHKLIRRNAVEELFDLTTDPWERAPRDPSTPAHRAISNELRAALDAAEAMEVAPPSTFGLDESGHDPGADEARELEERMKLLGYM